jgi:plasmid stabilization system protein ParE
LADFLDPFQLAEDAILDIDAIWLYLREKEGFETADRIVTELFEGLYRPASRRSQQRPPPRRPHQQEGRFPQDFFLSGRL